MELDYPNTCPDIDKSIYEAKGYLKSGIESAIEECCPYIGSGDLDKISGEHAESIYIDIEPIFEEVRSTNSDMRKEADRQISALHSIIEVHEETIRELEDRISDLEEQAREFSEQLDRADG